MSVDEKRAFALLENLAFERVSGSEEEKRAARIIADEAVRAGIRAIIEPFEVEDGEVSLTELEVLEPYRKTYTAVGYRRSLSTPPEGLTADFCYVEDALEANLAGVRGKIVLLNGGRISREAYGRLMKAGVAGIITWDGDITRQANEGGPNRCELRVPLTNAFGACAAANIDVRDAMELVARGASRIRLNIQAENVTRGTQNVIAEIPGTEKPEEVIALTAHYDSVFFSTGVYDNGAGCVVLTELLRHFSAHPAKRTLRFIWCGSEEKGLLGSWHYVKAHKDELDKILCVVNSDVGGAILGFNRAKITADRDAVAYIDALLKERGYAFEISQDLQSSDSVPFADNGIPGLNLNRAAVRGAGEMHTRWDTLSFLSAEGIGKVLYPTLDVVDRLANASVFPIRRGIPPEIREKLDKYLLR